MSIHGLSGDSVLFVDTRAGSVDLIEPLKKMGLPVEGTRLEFGDIAFEGRGEKGRPVTIGIEFKQLSELVEAMRTERLQGHQLRGMRGDVFHPGMFDYSYLMFEGEISYDRRGQLTKKHASRFGGTEYETMPGRMTIGELLKRIYVLHLCGGLNPWPTVTRRDTLKAIEALYHTWTDVDLDEHKSHLAIYEAPPLLPISDFRRTVKTFPHIGMRGSLAVELQFNGSLRKAVNASASTWANILTLDKNHNPRRLGDKVAEDIIKFVTGEN